MAHDFFAPVQRPLPVVLLIDVSASMKINGKIQTLNAATSAMIETFADEQNNFAQIQVAVITFGQESAKIHLPLQPATKIKWQNMEAKGKTPLGAAFSLVTKMLEDPDQIPLRAYSPTLLLVSDGRPTDQWEAPFEQLLQSQRTQKASRFAMAIGDDADMDMLKRFVSDPHQHVFLAHEARQVNKFFQWVTNSVTQRSRNMNPNIVPSTTLDDIAF